MTALSGITNYWPVMKWSLVWLGATVLKKLCNWTYDSYSSGPNTLNLIDPNTGEPWDPYGNKKFAYYGSYTFLMAQVICLSIIAYKLNQLEHSPMFIAVVLAAMQGADLLQIL